MGRHRKHALEQAELLEDYDNSIDIEETNFVDDVDPTFRSNSNLKRVGTKINFTQEQIEEYIKCSKDCVYFVKNYVKIINIDRGLVKFELFPFQEEMLKVFLNNTHVIGKIGRQSGKCVNYLTLITLRNKKTNEKKVLTIGEFYDMISSG